MTASAMVLKPRMSEKTYALSQAKNVYVFGVPKSANKHTVAEAVTAQFKVTVEAVNIVNQKGKSKRTVRKNGRPIAGRQSDVKKAYVTVKSGQNIPIFAAVEESEKKAQKAQEKAAKKKGEDK
jgi:large subunit ribosomal protein L23